MFCYLVCDSRCKRYRPPLMHIEKIQCCHVVAMLGELSWRELFSNDSFVFYLNSLKYSSKENKDYYFPRTSAIERPQYVRPLLKASDEILERKVQLSP